MGATGLEVEVKKNNDGTATHYYHAEDVHDFAWVTARDEVFNGGGAIHRIERPALTSAALMDNLAEQLLAGITTTTDMYFFGEEVCEVLVEAGMRGVVAESLIGFATPRCATTEEMLARQRELIEAYREHELITPSVAAHAPYSVAAPELVKEAELAEEFGVPMQIHLAETRWEVERLLEEKGMQVEAHPDVAAFRAKVADFGKTEP